MSTAVKTVDKVLLSATELALRLEITAAHMEDLVAQLGVISIAKEKSLAQREKAITIREANINMAYVAKRARNKGLTREQAIDAGFTIQIGSRGGVFYMNDNKKVYIAKVKDNV